MAQPQAHPSGHGWSSQGAGPRWGVASAALGWVVNLKLPAECGCVSPRRPQSPPPNFSGVGLHLDPLVLCVLTPRRAKARCVLGLTKAWGSGTLLLRTLRSSLSVVCTCPGHPSSSAALSYPNPVTQVTKGTGLTISLLSSEESGPQFSPLLLPEHFLCSCNILPLLIKCGEVWGGDSLFLNLPF